MSEPALEIRTLTGHEQMATIIQVFQQVWGTVTPIVNVELLMAISHSGGYVSGVYEGGRLMGASFGFLARHDDQPALHSHVTGVLPGVQHSGVGRVVKQHQRDWASARSIPWITWTFDPLVRRNAWFNIEVLGTHVAEYLVNFYGEMSDSINAHDESDRLLVAWPTDSAALRPEARSAAASVEVPTPDDIVVLRRTNPAAAMDWRFRLRGELGRRIEQGWRVTGFTRDGNYVLHEAR